MALLREVLRKVLEDSLQIQEDVVSNCYGRHVSLAQQVKKELPEGYLFYDWFLRLKWQSTYPFSALVTLV